MPKADPGPDSRSATFARDLGLLDATMIGVGAMIGAGIFVLTGIAAGEAGPASILAFALNGVVTLLTAFAYAELASAIPRAGGGYSFVRMAFPGGAGFAAGWMLWFAYTVACSLYALGFAGYLWEFLQKYTPAATDLVSGVVGQQPTTLVFALMVGLLFVALNARGAGVTGKTENVLTMSKLVVLCIFVFFGLRKIVDQPQQAMESFTPFLPAGLGGVMVAMGLTFIAFEGYDLIATVAEEIKDPEKNIPRATFISLGVTVVIYLLILFVSLGAISPEGVPSWRFLGDFKETAIVRAAENFMPAVGVAIIVFGGLLSTMSALNATVMAASRVAFSMGRDLWLPRRMSHIDPKRRTPKVAIYITGIILISIALTLPIEAVGSAASLMFLLSFAMVNLSLIALRRKLPELPRKFKVPFYPVVPILGFSLNSFLALYQFEFQPIAWYVTIGWLAVGLLLYYAVFEKQAAHLEPQVLLPRRPVVEPDREPPILVALHNPDSVEALFDVAIPVAELRGIPLVAITVVEVPRQMPIQEGMRFVHHREPLLEQAKKVARERQCRLETDVVIAHNASDGILAAAGRHRADMLVMGWKGFTNARDRVFGEVADRTIRNAPCDLLLLKLGDKKEISRCLFPTAGGPHAKFACTLLDALTKHLKMSVTVVSVVAPEATEEQRAVGHRYIDETLADWQGSGSCERQLIEAHTAAGGIASASRDYDLVVIGAGKEPYFRKVLFGEIPEKVARFSPASVLVVKRYEGVVKSILKRILG